MKNLTIRLVWHDSGWNGRICENPSGNNFCRRDYSLLSSRVKLRTNTDLEDKYSEKYAGEIMEIEGYVPPYYWSINLTGDDDIDLVGLHPFSDTKGYGEMFGEGVPLLRNHLNLDMVMT